MAKGWVIDDLAQVAANGNVTQLYPPEVPAGANPATATWGQTIRRPMQGALHSIQIKPNGTDGGTIEIYDISGLEIGADVSSGTTITNAQLVAAIAAKKAFKIYDQSFAGTVGSGPINAAGIFRSFMKGLAARFIVDDGAPSGECTLDLVVDGGYMLVTSAGQ